MLKLYFKYMYQVKEMQEMISTSINACFQILLIFSLFIMLLYTCNWIEVNKILFTLSKKTSNSMNRFKRKF